MSQSPQNYHRSAFRLWSEIENKNAAGCSYYKSFSHWDTLQSIMFSQLVCVATVTQPEDDQKLKHDKFRESAYIPTATREGSLLKRDNDCALKRN